jgi:putative peptide zinc metalloprotease protein
VTASAGHAGRPAPAWPPADAPGPGQVPRLAAGTELLGEYQGSGYAQPPSLARRADGQVIQMSALLYAVACRIDGSRDPAAIAALASADLGRSLTAGQVRYLITAKLLPLGITAAGDAPAAAPTASPLLALRARGTLLPERAANAAGALLTPLFRWPVIVAVAASITAADWWLFAVHGLGGGTRQVLRTPADLLAVLGLSLLSAVFRQRARAPATAKRSTAATCPPVAAAIVITWPGVARNATLADHGLRVPPAARQQKAPTGSCADRECTVTRRFSSTPVITPPTVTGDGAVLPYAG